MNAARHGTPGDASLLDAHSPRGGNRAGAAPLPPAGRYVCDVCGQLVNRQHTSWICRFLAWLSR
jgi:hypothetical protein